MSKANQEAQRAAIRAQYQDLIESLAASGRLPFEDAARTALINALQDETADMEHAKRAIAEMNRAGAPASGQWTLIELRNFIGSMKQSAGRYDPNCKHCGGLGHMIVERDTQLGYRASGAAPCPAGCQPRGVGYNAETTR